METYRTKHKRTDDYTNKAIAIVLSVLFALAAISIAYPSFTSY